MKYLSVCSGIEAATVAWEHLGWEAVAFSEIEKFPRAVLKHHYPKTPLHGDFTTIGESDYGSIDLLVGGTPCQSFSIAGLRGGLDDDRGNLALEFLKLAQRKRPKWIVWENVPGVFSSLSHDAPDACPPDINLDGDDGPEDGEEVVVEDEYNSIESHAFSCFLAGLSELGYGFSYRVLDAQYFGVAQRRRRVFVIGYLGDWRPAKAVLFEPESLRGDSPPSRKAGTGTSAGFEVGPGAGGFTDLAPTLDARCKDGPIRNQLGMGVYGGGQCSGPREVAATLAAHGNRQDFDVENFVTTPVAFSAKDHGADATEDLSPTLRAGGADRSHANSGNWMAVAIPINTQVAMRHKALGESTGLGIGGDGDPGYTLQAGHSHAVATLTCGDRGMSVDQACGNMAVPTTDMAVRRLTPIECERLQGFPDSYTQIPWRKKSAADCPDGPRYKALGNSMAVPVMAWLGKRIQMVEDIKNE